MAGKEGLESVLDASRKVCLSRYEKPPFYPRGYRKLVREFLDAAKGSNSAQEMALVDTVTSIQVHSSTTINYQF